MTVAVTGAASGIGAACVLKLRDSGAHVIGVDVRDAPGVDVVADLATEDGRRHAIADVGRLADGDLRGLVTCAGVAGLPNRPGSLLVELNWLGTYELAEGLRPLLAKSGDASVVAISSNSTTIQPDVPIGVTMACLAGENESAKRLADAAGSLATYPATKLAVARWVRRRAPQAEWIGSGVRLNAVAPGLVETPLAVEQRSDPVVGPLVRDFPIPLGRAGEPGEIAALVDFLLGPDGGFFCGSVLFVDGGSDALLRADAFPTPWELSLGSSLGSS